VRVIRYIVVLGLLGISFGILGRSIYLDGYYYLHAPRREDRARGAVVPVTVHHGTRVFLTLDEWGRFDSPTAVAVQSTVFLGAAAVACVLNQKWKAATTEPGRRTPPPVRSEVLAPGEDPP
jgi:hypothetical protein